MASKERLYQIALWKIPGIGPRNFFKLLKYFGSIEEVFKGSPEALSSHLSPKVIRFILEKGKITLEAAKRELELLESLNSKILFFDEEEYPKRLLQIQDPPPLLYTQGKIPCSEAVAIVGTRSADRIGLEIAFELARDLANEDITVISGGARGIDTSAHKGSLASEGKTVVVLGTGIDITYPSANQLLFKKIPQKGAIITEFPLGTPPRQANFPRRNRILSALADIIVVIQGDIRSGALLTAKFGLHQGRVIAAVPGNPKSPLSQAPNMLIKQGAKLVESSQDLLRLLNRSKKYPEKQRPKLLKHNLPSKYEEIIKNIGFEPDHIEHIAKRSKMNIGDLLGLLLELEIKGIIESSKGQFYRRLI
jgi:DNA processing protein